MEKAFATGKTVLIIDNSEDEKVTLRGGREIFHHVFRWCLIMSLPRLNGFVLIIYSFDNY